MKNVYIQEAVRKACLRDGKTQRTVARELGIARNTVSKLLKEADSPRYRLSKAKAKPVLGPYTPVIEAWLKADEKAPRKQGHTAKRIYERLREEYGFSGSERRVREYVAQVKEKPKEVFLPLAFEPGEMAQVDWAEVKAIIAGQFCKLQLFALVLNHSGATYYQAFERANQEAFFEGHHQAFLFFGGVPRTITYDNLKSAVQKVLKGRNREENERFVTFRSAWLFDSRFCNPARGNEKGRVENMIKYAERNFFAPVPVFDSLAELNIWLKERCLEYQVHVQARQEKTVGEKLLEERPCLLQLPNHLPECCRILSLKADKSALVQFETNRYSVPTEYAYRHVWLKAFVDRVEITDQEKIIATHSRLTGRFQESIRFEHYRKVLERKPGAFNHLRAIEKESLPPKNKPVYPKTNVQAPSLAIYRQLLRNPTHDPNAKSHAGDPPEKATAAQHDPALPQAGLAGSAK